MVHTEEKYYTGRVVQLDARILDDSLVSLIRTQLNEIAKNLLPDNPINSSWWHQWFYNNVEIFLDYAVQLVYYSIQIINGQSPGQRLMNNRYGNFNRFKGIINYFVGIVLPATTNILTQAMSTSSYSCRIFVDRLELAFKLVDFLYFFYFINRGGPAKPTEKLLRIESIYDKKPNLVQINFGALNREILGHSFAQMIILLSPLWSIIQRSVVKMFKKTSEKYIIDNNPLSPIICEECLQKSICPVRIKKEANAEDHNGRIYCYFCYINYTGSTKERSKMQQFEQISFDSNKRIIFE